jgi:hypothetical protein
MRGSIAGLFGVLLVVGCNEVGSADTAPLNLEILGSTKPFVPIEELPPLEGARICELDTDNCVLTDEGGNAAIELPIDEETAFTIEKEGYDRMLYPEVIPAGAGPVRLNQHWGTFSVEGQARFYECLESPFPRIGTGELWIEAHGVSRTGVTFELPGATGKLWYEDPDASDFCERWDNDLTATAASGVSWRVESLGGFVEVPEGTFRVDFGGTVEECSTWYSGWPREDGIWVPIREGYTTLLVVFCE